LIEFYNEATQLSQSESDKNTVNMKVTSINDKTIEVVDNKSGKEAGACHGDSGGPAFVQLPNGEWRQFAVIAQKNPLCHLGNLLMKVHQE
jgi:secreted trypsin-like serine protease